MVCKILVTITNFIIFHSIFIFFIDDEDDKNFHSEEQDELGIPDGKYFH